MQISVLNATIKIEIFCIYDRKGAKNAEGRKGLRTWYVLILFLLLYNFFWFFTVEEYGLADDYIKKLFSLHKLF